MKKLRKLIIDLKYEVNYNLIISIRMMRCGGILKTLFVFWTQVFWILSCLFLWALIKYYPILGWSWIALSIPVGTGLYSLSRKSLLREGIKLLYTK